MLRAVHFKLICCGEHNSLSAKQGTREVVGGKRGSETERRVLDRLLNRKTIT